MLGGRHEKKGLKSWKNCQEYDKIPAGSQIVLHYCNEDELQPQVDLRDSGWKYRIDNPSPLEIRIWAENIDKNKNYAVWTRWQWEKYGKS